MIKEFKSKKEFQLFFKSIRKIKEHEELNNIENVVSYCKKRVKL